jgi:hypothetical protein
VLVRFNHVARFIVNVNHSAMRAAAKLRIVDCIRLAVPQATEWQRIGNQIDAAMIFARRDLVFTCQKNVNGTRAWLIFPGRARHRENAFTAALSRSLEPVLCKTVTCVTVPVSGRNTMSQIPLPVICLWRASTGYVGRGMLSIYHRSSNGTVTSASIARA